MSRKTTQAVLKNTVSVLVCRFQDELNFRKFFTINSVECVHLLNSWPVKSFLSHVFICSGIRV